MRPFKRIFVVVMDSVGIGEAPDAAVFGDAGADTLGHIATHMEGLHMPTMEKLGLGNMRALQGIAKTDDPKSFYTKMQEASASKDTMTGHWEIMGLYIDKPFQTFPEGFPDALVEELEAKTGRKVIGNKPASGTMIIEELGKEHMETGALIVYTSADSVLQIAAHEDVIPVDELYQICEMARELTMQGAFLVGRVIARPFIGALGHFERTANRHDYALKPFDKTVMNTLEEADYDVISLGKIVDIFDGEGITKATRTISNDDGMDKLAESMKEEFTGLCFLNLVDFDAKYGHRRDPQGYGEALERFDYQLSPILDQLLEDDLLMITADHGNDPVHLGTDHTREFVPLLVYYKRMEAGGELPIRQTFADIGATIAENFQVPLPKHGTSFLKEIKKKGG